MEKIMIYLRRRLSELDQDSRAAVAKKSKRGEKLLGRIARGERLDCRVSTVEPIYDALKAMDKKGQK